MKWLQKGSLKSPVEKPGTLLETNWHPVHLKQNQIHIFARGRHKMQPLVSPNWKVCMGGTHFKMSYSPGKLANIPALISKKQTCIQYFAASAFSRSSTFILFGFSIHCLAPIPAISVSRAGFACFLHSKQKVEPEAFHLSGDRKTTSVDPDYVKPF